MRFDPGETREEKQARVREWHEWFAWYSVKIGVHDVRWLSTVERSVHYGYAGGSFWWARYRPLHGVEDKRLGDRRVWQWDPIFITFVFCAVCLIVMTFVMA